MLCSAWASGGSGGSVTAIPGVAPVFASGVAAFASALAGFASGAACTSGGAPPRDRWARAIEETIVGRTPERHSNATNFEREKGLIELIPQILHTYPEVSHNPDKYFCILTRRR